MAKLKLDVESLDVQSFETAPELVERGTVKGNACSDSTCIQDICTCTDAFGNCFATNVNCNSGGTGTGGTGGDSRFSACNTCATGGQEICSCTGSF